MNDLFKKSLNVIKNPYIILLLVAYLFLSAGLFPILILKLNIIAFILLILLTAAFFGGWFGLIKFVVSYKETGNREKDMENQFTSFKSEFFSSVPQYMLSLIFYMIVFAGICALIMFCADKLIGRSNELFEQVTAIAGNQDVLYNFITTLPDDAKILIIKRSLFVYFSFLVYFYLTFYSIPALYFQKGLNPISGLFNGVKALFKKPLLSTFLFIILIIANIFLTLFEGIAAYYSSILMFIGFIIRIYFAVFVVVLIFSVYEKYFTDNCNNGSDSIGENKTCD